MSAEKPVSTSAYVQWLLARRSDLELSFAQHRSTGTVHILIPIDPDVEPVFEPTRGPDAFDVIDWVLDKRRTLCGWVAHLHHGGFKGGDQAVGTFADSLLCGRCHAALGPHAPRAFDRPNTEEDQDCGEDATADFHRRRPPI